MFSSFQHLRPKYCINFSSFPYSRVQNSNDSLLDSQIIHCILSMFYETPRYADFFNLALSHSPWIQLSPSTLRLVNEWVIAPCDAVPLGSSKWRGPPVSKISVPDYSLWHLSKDRKKEEDLPKQIDFVPQMAAGVGSPGIDLHWQT